MKVAVVQFNPKIGDFASNGERMRNFVDEARKAGADLVVFPELATTGYPPGDLLDYKHFIDGNLRVLEELGRVSQGISIVCGYVERNPEATGKPYFNSAAVFQNGKRIANYRKRLLPYYDVFDEERYFEAGNESLTFEVGGKKVALTICEDLWNRPGYVSRPYRENPKIGKVDLILNLSASPFSLGKPEKREELFRLVAREAGACVVVAGQAGGNDDLLFDGGSLIIDGTGKIIASAPAFEEYLLLDGLADVPNSETGWISAALITGIREYVRKCGARKVCLGLSGGVDSSVVAVLAAKALGPKNVKGVALPTRFNASASLEDAEALAKALSIEYSVYQIDPLFQKASEMLKPRQSLTLENIQPRLRMVFLMAVANDEDRLLLNTSNKSEIASGYATLYGDSAGALAVLGDLTKRQVYGLAKTFPEIPSRVVTRAPSAELKENQTDQDTLPPYDALDAWVVEGIEKSGAFPSNHFARLYSRSEYKRHQLPPALRISYRAFGRGRRIPIAASSLVDGPNP